MTSIAATGTPPQAGAETRNSSNSGVVGYDAFLKLLVATMQKQDPTQPNDPSQTLSQLASFSNVEQSMRLNDKLDRLLSASSVTQAAALVGRKVASLDGLVTGTVAKVEVSGDGVTVLLEGGQRLAIQQGLRIES